MELARKTDSVPNTDLVYVPGTWYTFFFCACVFLRIRVRMEVPWKFHRNVVCVVDGGGFQMTSLACAPLTRRLRELRPAKSTSPNAVLVLVLDLSTRCDHYYSRPFVPSNDTRA